MEEGMEEGMEEANPIPKSQRNILSCRNSELLASNGCSIIRNAHKRAIQ